MKDSLGDIVSRCQSVGGQQSVDRLCYRRVPTSSPKVRRGWYLVKQPWNLGQSEGIALYFRIEVNVRYFVT